MLMVFANDDLVQLSDELKTVQPVYSCLHLKKTFDTSCQRFFFVVALCYVEIGSMIFTQPIDR